MIKGKAELTFGTGDICAVICEHKTDKNQIAIFMKTVEAGEIRYDSKPVNWSLADAEVAMIFTKPESIDLLVNTFMYAKEALLELVKEGEENDHSEG